ncbi:monocarboxylate transporter 9-like [Octopus vulgaris]|uniref:Monocarboxylate transporter 9-like n=1 Tax=Octopus vulgaris TaxID=6645 RepID=A0AA36BPX4_OCTVU|nr:monocarboxylate transporter 9-like [Octopus vulgaris]
MIIGGIDQAVSKQNVQRLTRKNRPDHSRPSTSAKDSELIAFSSSSESGNGSAGKDEDFPILFSMKRKDVSKNVNSKTPIKRMKFPELAFACDCTVVSDRGAVLLRSSVISDLTACTSGECSFVIDKWNVRRERSRKRKSLQHEGTGIGMAFITANVIIVLYFTSKRAIAVGIAMSGSGVGVFVYSFVVEALLQYYGWQGTILTLVGIILHIVICGAMFRPLQWILNKKYFSGSSRNSDPSTDSCYKDNSDISLISSSTLNNDYFYKNLSNQLEIPSHLKTAGNLSPARYHRKFSDGTIVSLDKNQFTLSSDPSIFKSILYPSHIRGHAKKTLSPSSNSLFMRSKRLRDPTLPSIFRGSTNLRCISMETIGALYSSSVLRDDKFEKSTSSSENSTCSFDFSMFTDVVMVFLLVAMTLSTVQGAVLTHLPSYALSLGINSVDVAMIVSVLGIMVSVGQMGVGLIIDFLPVPIIYAYSFAMVLACAVVAVIPLVHSVYILAFCAGVFGFFIGWIISLRTILLADLVGVANLTHVFGVVAFFQGTGFIVSPPLAGLLYDYTQSYMALFMLCTASYGLAAIFTLILCYFYRKQDSQNSIKSYPVN